MSTNLHGLLGPPYQVVLFWPDETHSRVCEQSVEVLETTFDQVVVRTDVQVRVETPVLLRTRAPLSGIVGSCLNNGHEYVVTINLQSDVQAGFEAYVDPGALVVDSYMTDEQMDDILREFSKEAAAPVAAEPVPPTIQHSRIGRDPRLAEIC